MKSLEYCRTEVSDETPGSLSHEDFMDAIGCMTEIEFAEMSKAFAEYNDSIVGTIIRKSICRQYSETIEREAQESYQAYQEALREDAEDIRYNMARGM